MLTLWRQRTQDDKEAFQILEKALMDMKETRTVKDVLHCDQETCNNVSNSVGWEKFCCYWPRAASQCSANNVATALHCQLQHKPFFAHCGFNHGTLICRHTELANNLDFAIVVLRHQDIYAVGSKQSFSWRGLHALHWPRSFLLRCLCHVAAFQQTVLTPLFYTPMDTTPHQSSTK